jgi:hypothetical protein
MGDTGATGAIEVLGVTGTTYLASISQLERYSDTIVQYENTDKKTMNFIIQPSTSEIQKNLIQWASIGFPPNYPVLSISLIRPSPCSDGKERDMQEYISYLTGFNIGVLTADFQSNFLDIAFWYTISGNIVNLHARKI